MDYYVPCLIWLHVMGILQCYVLIMEWTRHKGRLCTRPQPCLSQGQRQTLSKWQDTKKVSFLSTCTSLVNIILRMESLFFAIIKNFFFFLLSQDLLIFREIFMKIFDKFMINNDIYIIAYIQHHVVIYQCKTYI